MKGHNSQYDNRRRNLQVISIPLGIPLNDKYSQLNGETPQQIVNRKITELSDKLKNEGVVSIISGRGGLNSWGLITNTPYIIDKLKGKLFSEMIPILDGMLSNYKNVAKELLGIKIAGEEAVINPTPTPTPGEGGGTGTTTTEPENTAPTQEEPKKILGMSYKQAGAYGGGLVAFITLAAIFGPKLFKKIAGIPASK